MSNTADWKLIEFANITLLKDQTTALIKKQNTYLHEVYAISFIIFGSLDGKFKEDNMKAHNNKRKHDDCLDERGGKNDDVEIQAPSQDRAMIEEILGTDGSKGSLLIKNGYEVVLEKLLNSDSNGLLFT